MKNLISENLVNYAKSVDVLIHEVIAIREEAMITSALARKITNFHTQSRASELVSFLETCNQIEGFLLAE